MYRILRGGWVVVQLIRKLSLSICQSIYLYICSQPTANLPNHSVLDLDLDLGLVLVWFLGFCFFLA